MQARLLCLIEVGLLLSPLAGADFPVNGRVVDENNAAVGAVRISFRPAAPPDRNTRSVPGARTA